VKASIEKTKNAVKRVFSPEVEEERRAQAETKKGRLAERLQNVMLDVNTALENE